MLYSTLINAIKPHPIPSLTEKEVAKFWSKIDIKGPDECWPWLGSTTRGVHGGSRYGTWTVRGYHLRPHRVAYTLLVGPIPDGLTLDHVKARGCETTLCCNPAHAEPVTQSVNSKRHYDFIGTPTHCKWGHRRHRGERCHGCDLMNARLWRERHPKTRRRYSIIPRRDGRAD